MEQQSGIVFDVARWAGHDGPGIRSIGFLKGCALRCVWCQSPESQSPNPELLYVASKCIQCGACIGACAEGARHLVNGVLRTDRQACTNCGSCASICYVDALELAGHQMTAGQVIDELALDEVFYRNSGGGVTISGGEPLCQPGLVRAIASGCRDRGISVAIETCGHVPWDALRDVEPLIDLFLYDLKIMDSTRHRNATGKTNEVILANLAGLAALRRETHGYARGIQVRVPLIPGYTDDEDNLRLICAYTALLGIEHIALLPYNPATEAKYQWLERPYRLGDLQQQEKSTLERIVALAESYGLTAQIGG